MTLVPHYLQNTVIDVIEWDGQCHTVSTGAVEHGHIEIDYCDGVKHIVDVETFMRIQHGVHHYNWTHYFSGGGSNLNRSPFFHAKGCNCKPDICPKTQQKLTNTSGPDHWKEER